MKKILISIIIAAVIIGGYLYYDYKTGGEVTGKTQKTAPISAIYLNNASPTTTETVLWTSGDPNYSAVSTWSFSSNRISEEDRELRIRQRGSSTASILNWYWETSYDQIDWYRENIATSTSAVASPHSYNPIDYYRDYHGTASSTMTSHASTTLSDYNIWDDSYVNKFTIKIPELTANYLRLTFWETGATSSIWMMIPHRNIGE